MKSSRSFYPLYFFLSRFHLRVLRSINPLGFSFRETLKTSRVRRTCSIAVRSTSFPIALSAASNSNIYIHYPLRDLRAHSGNNAEGKSEDRVWAQANFKYNSCYYQLDNASYRIRKIRFLVVLFTDILFISDLFSIYCIIQSRLREHILPLLLAFYA